MYEISSTVYKILLKGNITKTYEKVTPRLEDAIILEVKQIPKDIKLNDRI